LFFVAYYFDNLVSMILKWFYFFYTEKRYKNKFIEYFSYFLQVVQTMLYCTEVVNSSLNNSKRPDIYRF